MGSPGRDPRPRRPDEFAGLCGRLRVDWRFCEPADPQAEGAVERLQGYLETSFEPGRTFANELDFQGQLDAWFAKVNSRMHKTLRARPVVSPTSFMSWRRCRRCPTPTADGCCASPQIRIAV